VWHPSAPGPGARPTPPLQFNNVTIRATDRRKQ
jgi:hypothetical protein